jgi:hypothetical protein
MPPVRELPGLDKDRAQRQPLILYTPAPLAHPIRGPFKMCRALYVRGFSRAKDLIRVHVPL